MMKNCYLYFCALYPVIAGYHGWLLYCTSEPFSDERVKKYNKKCHPHEVKMVRKLTLRVVLLSA